LGICFLRSLGTASIRSAVPPVSVTSCWNLPKLKKALQLFNSRAPAQRSIGNLNVRAAVFQALANR
jgi:hypothetical protein